jgi:hypothetical protein
MKRVAIDNDDWLNWNCVKYTRMYDHPHFSLRDPTESMMKAMSTHIFNRQAQGIHRSKVHKVPHISLKEQ